MKDSKRHEISILHFAKGGSEAQLFGTKSFAERREKKFLAHTHTFALLYLAALSHMCQSRVHDERGCEFLVQTELKRVLPNVLSKMGKAG